MATIVTRATGTPAVNRPLTYTEIDNNFINLNTDIQTRATGSGIANGTNTGDQVLPTASSLGAEITANKDASNGYAGLSSYKINFKNAANTFTSYFANSNTSSRNYSFPDRDGTIADNTDLASKENLSNKDGSGGYAGLTGYSIDIKNNAGTFTSYISNLNTASRTYTLKDATGTLAFTSDITGTNSGTNTGDQTLSSLGAQATLVSGSNIKTLGGVSILGSGNISTNSVGSTLYLNNLYGAF